MNTIDENEHRANQTDADPKRIGEILREVPAIIGVDFSGDPRKKEALKRDLDDEIDYEGGRVAELKEILPPTYDQDAEHIIQKIHEAEYAETGAKNDRQSLEHQAEE